MQQNQQNMQKLAEMMQQMMDAAFMEQAAEDLQNLLQILDNTVTFSFNQEELISLHSNSDFDHQIMSKQKQLYRDFDVIKDSVYALAMRQPSVNAAVNKEIVSIETAFSQIDKDFNEDRIRSAKSKQQVVLTSANNLALFLSEVIENIQQQMANSKPGNQNCQKPGNNPNPNSMSNSMKSMQKSLQQQLEKMMEMMKNGENGQKMNGELGKALSQQEKMKDMLQKMMKQGNVGSKAYETLKQADELLNKVRDDILRNNLSEQTINRQKQIMTRLLEAENAQNERDLDEKRKSQTADQQRISETAKYFENSSTNTNFNEQLLRKKLILKRYYQNKFQNYVNELDSLNEQKY
jgi:predicted transcriptional regulator